MLDPTVSNEIRKIDSRAVTEAPVSNSIADYLKKIDHKAVDENPATDSVADLIKRMINMNKIQGHFELYQFSSTSNTEELALDISGRGKLLSVVQDNPNDDQAALTKISVDGIGSSTINENYWGPYFQSSSNRILIPLNIYFEQSLKVYAKMSIGYPMTFLLFMAD